MADGSVAAATPCQEVLALTARVSGLDHNPLNAKGRLLNGVGPSSLPASGRNRQGNKAEALKEVNDDDGDSGNWQSDGYGGS